MPGLSSYPASLSLDEAVIPFAANTSMLAAVPADVTVWMGTAQFQALNCITAGTLASVYDSSTGSGTVLLGSTVGTDGVSYAPTVSNASKGIHADWTSGTWNIQFTAPRQLFVVQAYSGYRTILSDNSSSFVANDGSKRRQQVFSGLNSAGLVDQSSGAGLPQSVQFGTGAGDVVPDTAFTAVAPNSTSSGMEAGGSSAAPCLVEVDGSGNQSLGYGRVRWNFSTKQLRLMQKADDALISLNPRVQLYARVCLNRTAFYYFHLDFALGDAETPWPAFVTGKNTTVIFQLKGGATYPPFDVQVRDAASGNTAKRDLYFLRRLTNVGPGGGGFDNQGQNRVLIVADVDLGVRYQFGIQVRLSWDDAEGFVRIFQNGIPQRLHSDVGGGMYYVEKTMYSATPNAVSAMWGIYRVNYASAKAPDDAAIVLYRAEVEVAINTQAVSSLTYQA